MWKFLLKKLALNDDDIQRRGMDKGYANLGSRSKSAFVHGDVSDAGAPEPDDVYPEFRDSAKRNTSMNDMRSAAKRAGPVRTDAGDLHYAIQDKKVRDAQARAPGLLDNFKAENAGDSEPDGLSESARVSGAFNTFIGKKKKNAK